MCTGFPGGVDVKYEREKLEMITKLSSPLNRPCDIFLPTTCTWLLQDEYKVEKNDKNRMLAVTRFGGKKD
jgi:hypothetical protein